MKIYRTDVSLSNRFQYDASFWTLKFVTALDPNFSIILAISASMSVAEAYLFLFNRSYYSILLPVDRIILTSIFKTLYTVILML